MTTIAVHPAGALIALAVVAAVIATFYWMLHPPRTKADIEAKQAEAILHKMVGSIIVVFSEGIHSEHMMVLAARLARNERADLFAVYVIEVPLIFPEGAEMPEEDRAGYDMLATAEVIAQHHDVHLHTEVLHARSVSAGVLELAKRENANLIVLGSYREGKYTGAPLGRAIEEIATRAKCDVLIGVPGPYGVLLGDRN
ncbi:MAG TPA: universal stress protein [Candidatus Lustribacter sp.]|nr:universal stress protein [Candidatus Lustribacter sp.]